MAEKDFSSSLNNSKNNNTPAELKPAVEFNAPKPKLDFNLDRILNKIIGFFKGGMAAPKAQGSSLSVLDMDLIKDEIPVVFNWRKNLYFLGGVILLTLIMVGEAYFVLYNWEKNEVKKRSDYLKEEISKIDLEISDVKNASAQALVFKNKINAITPVFEKHVYWTNFFTFLEKNTLADIYYLDFTGDVSGAYVLKAVARDFRALGEQLKNFSKDPRTISASISNEKINNIEAGSGASATFDLNLKVKPALFTQ